jgi:DNA recombination protein
MDINVLLWALIMLLLGMVIGYLIARAGVASTMARTQARLDLALERADTTATEREALANQFRALSADVLERQTRQADRAADTRLAPINEALRQLHQRLGEVERQRATLSAELRQQVEGVRVSGEAVRKEAHSLATALRKPQIRGAWGESSLRRIVEIAGMVDRCHFDTQATYTTTEGQQLRPDMRVSLADGRVVFVDSKVPLEAVIEAYQADGDAERDEQLRRFARHVRTHIDQLSAKEYWSLDAGSPDFVVLFLGSDEFYRLALEQQPDLHEYAVRRNITLAGPGLLIPLLQTISHGWRQARLAESAAEVARLGQTLHERLGKLGDHFAKLGSALNTTVRHYNSAVGTLESRVLVSARRFRDLDVTTADIPPLNPVETSPRRPVAPELVGEGAASELENPTE